MTSREHAGFISLSRRAQRDNNRPDHVTVCQMESWLIQRMS